MAQLTDYLDLIPPANSDKPNFLAFLSAMVQPFVDEINVLEGVPLKFDLDVAQGMQLDVVGEWVGLSRILAVPISGVYFSFDTSGVGFDQGLWLGPSDPTEGVVTLDDETYRNFLYIKIAANHWNGSLGDAQRILAEVFQSQTGTLFFIQDNFDMTMTIGIAGVLPSELFIALLQDRYIFLKPAAVGIREVIITSVDGDSLFGFDNDNPYIQGFDEGAWGTIT